MRFPFTCLTLAAWAGLVGAGACGAAPRSPNVEARRHFLVGGESSVFTPCGASEAWWVDAAVRQPGADDSLAVFHRQFTPRRAVAAQLPQPTDCR